ncbi:MAG: group 1 truncated hemoglobin [Bryobacteraceae bacterium]
MATLAVLYQRLGGEQAFQGIVAEFYRRVLADASLAPFFARVDMRALQDHQRAFLIQVLGGPGHYLGRDMKSAHAGLKIQKRDFYAVADHLINALTVMGVDEETVGEVVDRLEPLSREIVNHPGGD